MEKTFLLIVQPSIDLLPPDETAFKTSHRKAPQAGPCDGQTIDFNLTVTKFQTLPSRQIIHKSSNLSIGKASLPVYQDPAFTAYIVWKYNPAKQIVRLPCRLWETGTS
jgi:hypothetical protein